MCMINISHERRQRKLRPRKKAITGLFQLSESRIPRMIKHRGLKNVRWLYCAKMRFSWCGYCV